MSFEATELAPLSWRSVLPVPSSNEGLPRPSLTSTVRGGTKARVRSGCVLNHGDYRVSAAHSREEQAKAGELVARMYSSRGYHTDRQADCTLDPRRITFTACRGSEVFGTLTLGLDSEEGLLADGLYGDHIVPYRRRGCRPCELSRFAIDPEYSSKEVLALLFNLAYIYARFVHDATDAFIEVNPRHAPFYRRMLGFRQIGDERCCPRVNAPAVFLHLELEYMDAQIEEHGGTFDARQRSLYPYFTVEGDSGVRVHRRLGSRRSTPDTELGSSGHAHMLAHAPIARRG